MPMLVAALEERMARIGTGGDVGDEIENLLVRQLIEQTFGHDGHG